MFTFLTWAIAAVVACAMWYAYAKSRDVFHPLMFIGPMLLFMYVWMPVRLDSFGGLDGFFQRDQLDHIQSINAIGVICLVLGCLSVGFRRRTPWSQTLRVSAATLAIWGTILGCLGLAAWVTTIVNVGGLQQAFSAAYAGGWDDNGYIRDAPLLLFPGFLLVLSAAFVQGFQPQYLFLLPAFVTPWVITAALTARRGPTFMIVVILAMGWYMNRHKRPSLLATALSGLLLGVLLLFLVTNRSSIYVGSDQELTTDVTTIVDKPDTGNEYIYGAGGILSSEQRQSFYWGRRYFAQVLVRPIPHSIWPTKYEDFGVPELLRNAGTGEGFMETLGWEGAVGSAPGLIADLWMEFWWLGLPVLFLLGRFYGSVWLKATVAGGPWISQYIIMAALSIYLVMQTGEAVIFRSLLMCLPLRLTWHFAHTRALSLPVISARQSAPNNQPGRSPQSVF
jgi:hypothetical protein